MTRHVGQMEQPVPVHGVLIIATDVEAGTAHDLAL